MTEVESRMIDFGTIRVGDTDFPVQLTPSGMFVAEIAGETETSETLGGLRSMLSKVIRGTRLEVGFVTGDGDEGVVRGLHASQHKLLVTWKDGEKGTLDTFEHVFPAGELSEQELVDLRHWVLVRNEGQRKVREYRSRGVPVKKLFDEIAPRFKDRNGGYTRVVKFGERRGDAALLSGVEFTGGEEQAKGKQPKKKRSAKKTTEREARQAAALA